MSVERMVVTTRHFLRFLELHDRDGAAPRRLNQMWITLFRALTDNEGAVLEAGQRLSPAQVAQIAERTALPADHCAAALDNFLIWRSKLIQ